MKPDTFLNFIICFSTSQIKLLKYTNCLRYINLGISKYKVKYTKCNYEKNIISANGIY